MHKGVQIRGFLFLPTSSYMYWAIGMQCTSIVQYSIIIIVSNTIIKINLFIINN